MGRTWPDRLRRANGAVERDHPLAALAPRGGGRPTLAIECAMAQAGVALVAGVDEVGRGALAGPLVAAAVILPAAATAEAARLLAEALGDPRDSKQMTAARRVATAARVRQLARHVAVAAVPESAIDALGMGAANKLALRSALAQLDAQPYFALVDALVIPELAYDQLALVDGDQRSLSIAAASVVAKVARDALLDEAAQRYPGYGFAAHKGYGTAAHLAALARLGPCPLHRCCFAPVRRWQPAAPDTAAGAAP